MLSPLVAARAWSLLLQDRRHGVPLEAQAHLSGSAIDGGWTSAREGGASAEGFHDAVVSLQRADVLHDIQYRPDLLAVEAKYHNSCYRSLMHAASRGTVKAKTADCDGSSKSTSTLCSPRPLQKSFDSFCMKVIVDSHL